jgi:hypothetical protein
MKINKRATANHSHIKMQEEKGHLNHMDGISYDIPDPIKQLRIIASSSFFGEPNYYHEDVKKGEKRKSEIVPSKDIYEKYIKHLEETLGKVISIPNYHSLSTTMIMEIAIDEAISFDAEAALKEAVRLRNEENIRTTPQVIMVRAANHKKVRGTGLIRKYALEIMKRTDEAAVQLAYQLQVFGRPIPNSLKKSWKLFLETRNEYQISKYRMEKRAYKTLDVVNLVHAKSSVIDLLMKGELKLKENTWESFISANGSTKENWIKAIDLMGHMALLRNIVNFIKNDVNHELYLPKLKDTAKTGNQLPFRYYSAYNMAKSNGANGVILDAIEECLELSLDNLPHFEGKTMSLCDNSGSAHGAFTSSAGTMTVAKIANLTSVITAKVSDEGYVGVFGDKLDIIPIRKKDSIFNQTEIANNSGNKIGHGTENGIWLFFDKAIKQKEHWDNIFVYSDMQAGHGGLFGINPDQYSKYIWKWKRNRENRYIDVAKLINDYRNKVNPNVNIFLVQVAGYKDALAPEFYNKTYILGGWGDGLLRFAKEISKEI